MTSVPASIDYAGINYSAFDTEPTRADVRTYRAQAKRAGIGRLPAWVPVVIVAASVIVFLIGGTVLAAFNGQPDDVLRGDASSTGIAILSAYIAVLAAGLAVALWLNGGPGSKWAKMLRINRFADANGLAFAAQSKNPQYRGAIFTLGYARMALSHISTTTGRYLDIGDYSYTTGSGKNRATHTWGFMAFHLDRPLPHMLLDAKSNDNLFGLSNLPGSFRRDQVLSLEGNFNEHFTLFCPKEYERDALYVFTPDLMALLIDNAGASDVEIVDDWMFVYTNKGLDTRSRTQYERMFRIAETVGAKTLSQTDRYRDEKAVGLPAGTIAAGGRRLRRGVPAVLVVVGIAIVAYGVLNTVLSLLVTR